MVGWLETPKDDTRERERERERERDVGEREMRAISNCRDTSVSTLMKIAAIWSPAAGTVAWRKHAWQLSSMARSAC